jgi:transcriptional regulator with XRE-family HTH domain
MGGELTSDGEDVGPQLGGAIRAGRRLLGMTLVEVAGSAGLSHPFLSQLERGLARPSMRSLTAIAATLGTTA